MSWLRATNGCGLLANDAARRTQERMWFVESVCSSDPDPKVRVDEYRQQLEKRWWPTLDKDALQWPALGTDWQPHHITNNATAWCSVAELDAVKSAYRSSLREKDIPAVDERLFGDESKLPACNANLRGHVVHLWLPAPGGGAATWIGAVARLVKNVPVRRKQTEYCEKEKDDSTFWNEGAPTEREYGPNPEPPTDQVVPIVSIFHKKDVADCVEPWKPVVGKDSTEPQPAPDKAAKKKKKKSDPVVDATKDLAETIGHGKPCTIPSGLDVCEIPAFVIEQKTVDKSEESR
jgi:hypothetical protein